MADSSLQVKDNAGAAFYIEYRDAGTVGDPARAYVVIGDGDAGQVTDIKVSLDSEVVSVDSELSAAAALTDAFANPTAGGVGAFGMVWNGVTWDRAPGDATNGLLVDLGANNDVVVSGTVTADAGSGTFTVDSELPAAAALADNAANPTAPAVGAFGMVWDGATWDRAPGTAADGLLVNLGANNDVVVSGTVDLGATDNAVLDNIDADTTTIATNTNDIPNVIGTDGAAGPSKAISIGGTDGSGNLQEITTDTDGHIQADVLSSALPTGAATAANQSTGNTSLSSIDGKLPAGAASADATANPTVSKVGAFGMVFNGTTWDRLRGNTVGVYAHGATAHGATTTGNPVRTGGHALAHGTNPTAVSAGQVSRHYVNRHGIPWVIGGHPNVKTAEYRATTAQTDDDILGAISAGTKYVVTSVMVTSDNVTTPDVGVRIGFGATTVPSEPADGASVTGVVFSHPGIAPGSGAGRGDGSGIIGIGGDGEELRITNEVPTDGSIKVVVTYYTIES